MNDPADDALQKNPVVVALALTFFIICGAVLTLVGVSGMGEDPTSGLLVAGLGIFTLIYFPAMAFSKRMQKLDAKVDVKIDRAIERVLLAFLVVGGAILLVWLVVSGVHALVTAPIGVLLTIIILLLLFRR